MTTSVVGKPKVINWPPRRPTTVGLRALPSIHFLPFPRRYEVARYVLLVDTKFTNWSNFVREAWLIDKRKMEQVQLFETADERGCTPMFGAAHRRESARIGGSLLLGGMSSLAIGYWCEQSSQNGQICIRSWHRRFAHHFITITWAIWLGWLGSFVAVLVAMN